MKTSLPLLLGAACWGLSGCGAAPQVAAPRSSASISVPTPAPSAPKTGAPVSTPAPSAPGAAPRIVQSGRSSLPTLPQMMDNAPRPTYVPVPTPRVRPGQTIVISNGTPPPPRENPTLIVSNAPVARESITPQAAAARELVWTDTPSRNYYRPGSRFFGATAQGFYLNEGQAKAQGYRLSTR